MENNSKKNYNEQRWSLTKSIRIQHDRNSEQGTVAEYRIREAQMLRKTPRYIVDRVVRQTLRNWIAAGNRASNWSRRVAAEVGRRLPKRAEHERHRYQKDAIKRLLRAMDHPILSGLFSGRWNHDMHHGPRHVTHWSGIKVHGPPDVIVRIGGLIHFIRLRAHAPSPHPDQVQWTEIAAMALGLEHHLVNPADEVVVLHRIAWVGGRWCSSIRRLSPHLIRDVADLIRADLFEEHSLMGVSTQSSRRRSRRHAPSMAMNESATVKPGMSIEPA